VRDPSASNRGFSVIELLIAISVIVIIVSIGMVILGRSVTRAANEAAALAVVRTLVSAERIYWSTAGQCKYGDLGQLSAATLVDVVVASGTRHGYTYVINNQGNTFTVTATPISEITGLRSYFADETGTIRGHLGAGASVSDPPIGE
jgi:prepilin-type N-terminal cleavage/methylation domain-containing protein